MAMAEIGATPNGGVKRLTMRVDAIGNMFARRTGRDPNRPPLLLFSHLDSQPLGGKLDGALGACHRAASSRAPRLTRSMSRSGPAAMIFTPRKAGPPHNKAEGSDPAEAVVARANRPIRNASRQRDDRAASREWPSRVDAWLSVCIGHGTPS